MFANPREICTNIDPIYKQYFIYTYKVIFKMLCIYNALIITSNNYNSHIGQRRNKFSMLNYIIFLIMIIHINVRIFISHTYLPKKIIA